MPPTEQLNQDSLKQNIIRDCFLRNKKIIYCPKQVQELRFESADSRRMELYQANQLSDHSQREKSWLCTEFKRIV